MAMLTKLFEAVTLQNLNNLSNSDSRSSGGSSATEVKKEDDLERECIISLWTRYAGVIIGYHWALVFDWKNPAYKATFEASEFEGRLTPYIREGGPDPNFKDWIAPSKEEIYHANKCSPKQVYKAAKSLIIGRNNRYNAMKANCHEWAKALALKFGVTLPAGPAADIRNYLGESKVSHRFDDSHSDTDDTEPEDKGFVAGFGKGVGRMLKNN